jgi:thiamine-monophosphate kinase
MASEGDRASSADGEFAFLERLAARLPARPDGQVGVGDDAAVLDGGLLAAVDTLVADRHFRLDWATPQDIGWKALAVNLSDIAAMGGEPVAALAAVTLPPEPAGLADRLADGLLEAAERYGCPLVGGDTTSGSVLVVTVTALGRMTEGRSPVLRSGAAGGDGVYVTGPLGGAAAALDQLVAGTTPSSAHAAALHRPIPRLAAGQAATDAGATAMIDISDGLAADLGHVLDASHVGVELDADLIPLATIASLEQALTGGDDYELCFTAPDRAAVTTAFAASGVDPPTRIGTITERDRSMLRHGQREPLPTGGWSHPIR